MLGFLIRIETVFALLILIVIPHPFHRNDVISGEVNLNGAGDVNLSSGSLYVLAEEISNELSSEDSVLPDELLAIVDEIPVVSEISETVLSKSVSVVSNVNSTGNDSGAIEEDIPSFIEWTQKVLAEEEKSGANGTSTGPSSTKTLGSTKLRQKNYASPDCGAKILTSNPEAGRTSSVLEPTRDEYLLSTCNSKLWFVIELCEAIQAQKIEIANFELFSSGPKDFQVYISDRFPTRDWVLLGKFVAADERTIQSFLLEQPLFGKFVKVEVVSHYGTEHFCPISLFRVYGNNEYEVLDIEESPTGEEFSTDEDGLDSKNNGEEEGRNIIRSVISIIKQTVDYSLGKANKETKDTNQTIVVGNPLLCYSSLEQHNITRAVNESLSCQWNLLNHLVALPWLYRSISEQCHETGHSSSYSPELGLTRAIWGAPTVRAMCHWAHWSYPTQHTNRKSTISPVNEVVIEKSVAAEERTETIFGPLLKAELEQLEKLLSSGEGFAGIDTGHVDSTGNEPSPAGDSKQDGSSNPKVSVVVPAAVPSTASGSLPAAPSVPVASANNVQQKESVFVRLTNRIKTLERNMSLSGQYLEELSRRYKRQVDDMQKNLNRTMQALNETLRRISTQEDYFQATFNYMNSEIGELKQSTLMLSEENLILRTQIIERHLFLMIMEVGIFLTVMFLMRRFGRPLKPRPEPEPAHSTRTANLALEYNVEAGQRVEKLTVLHVREPGERLHHKPSPTPSVADSTSSGCESAFSVPSYNAIRDASLEKPQNTTIRPKSMKGNKKKKKKGSAGSSSLVNSYHTKDSKSIPSSPKIRLKSDNWEWHSRAKILAAEFIRDSYESNEMRSSM